jgi:hypothetical protein
VDPRWDCRMRWKKIKCEPIVPVKSFFRRVINSACGSDLSDDSRPEARTTTFRGRKPEVGSSMRAWARYFVVTLPPSSSPPLSQWIAVCEDVFQIGPAGT